MNEKLQQHIAQAYMWLSKTPGDWGQLLDNIAMARQELREVDALAAAMRTSENNSNI